MAYRSILTVLTGSRPEAAAAHAAVDRAEAIARAEDGHLELLCLGVDRTQTGYYYAGANAILLQETIDRAAKESEALEAAVRERFRGAETRWSVETGVAPLADIGRAVAGHARFADLVVLPKPYGEDRRNEAEAVAEGVLFDSRAPLLVVPDGCEAGISPERVMIGWDESPEAMTAVRHALPLLVAADMVQVVVIDPPEHGPNRSDPGGPLSQFLARHGARVEIDVLSKSLPRVSDVLLRQAEDSQADMVVMGAYGHSRFREAILGGATRDMLEKSPVPLFMAH